MTLEGTGREAIARRLEATRRALGLRPVDLRRAIGVNPSTYSQWASGQRRPNLDAATRLAERFGLSLDWIYCGRLDSLGHDLAMKILALADAPGAGTADRARAGEPAWSGHDWEGAVGWVWATDENHRFTSFSGYIHGTFAPETFIGRTRWEVLGEGPETPFWRRHIADLVARREFHGLELRIVGEDGRSYDLTVSGAPLLGADGAFLGYRGTGVAKAIEAASSRHTAAGAGRA